MGSSIITADRKNEPARTQAKEVLNLELAEVREIADLMLQKIESQMLKLHSLEAALEAKRAGIERLLARADAQSTAAGFSTQAALPNAAGQRLESLETRLKNVEAMLALAGRKIAGLEQSSLRADVPGFFPGAAPRGQEIVALHAKGLASGEIAEALNMPQGEVDLILELKAN